MIKQKVYLLPENMDINSFELSWVDKITIGT